MDSPACPTCSAPVSQVDGHLVCAHGHTFTSDGLALAGNLAVVNALWVAIRAVEDDAAGLEWLVRSGQGPEQLRAQYMEQAAEGREAAAVLRALAVAAQARLAALPLTQGVLGLRPEAG